MNSCVVKNCRSNETTADSKVTFHLFPSNSVIYNEWVSAVRKSRGESWRPTATSAVCSQHFYDREMYVNRHGIRCVLSSGYPKKNLKIEPIISDNAVATSPQPANAAAQSDNLQRSEESVIDLSPEEADEPPAVADVAPPNPICVSYAESQVLQESWTMERLEAFSKEYLKHPVLHTSSEDGYVFRRYQQWALDDLAKSLGETNNMQFKTSCLVFRHKLSELIKSLVKGNIKEGIEPGRCLRDAPPAVAALAARCGLLRDALQKEFKCPNGLSRKMHWVGVAMCSAMYRAASRHWAARRNPKASKVPIKALRESLGTILPLSSQKVLTHAVTSTLWTRVCYVVQEKVSSLTFAGDRARRLPRHERLHASLEAVDWRLVDLLLACTDEPFKLVMMYSVEAVRALTVLVTLMRSGPPLARRRRWASVHRAYLRTGRIASMLLLQHRFAQLCELAAPHAPHEPHEPHGKQEPHETHEPHEPHSKCEPQETHSKCKPHEPHEPHGKQEPHETHEPHEPHSKCEPQETHSKCKPHEPHRPHGKCEPHEPHRPREPQEPRGPRSDRPPHPLLQVIIDDGFVSKGKNYWSHMANEGKDDSEEDAEGLHVEAKEADDLFDKVVEEFTEIEKCENITALKKFIRKNLLKEQKDNSGATSAVERIASYLKCSTDRKKPEPDGNTDLSMDVEGDEVIDLDCDEFNVNNNNDEDLDSNVIDLENDSDMEVDNDEMVTTDSKPKTQKSQEAKTSIEELSVRRKSSRQMSFDERRFSTQPTNGNFDDSDDGSSESDDEPLINIQAEMKLRPELKGLSQRFLRNPTNQCLLGICKPVVVKLQRCDFGKRRVVKKVELPDIEEVRRINSTILTAEVAPIASRKTTSASWRGGAGEGLAGELRLLQAAIRKIVGTHSAALDTLVNAMTVDCFDSKNSEEIVYQKTPERKRVKNSRKKKMTVDDFNSKTDEEIICQKAPGRRRGKYTAKIKTYESKFKLDKLPRTELTITEKVKSKKPKAKRNEGRKQIKPVLSMTVTETPQILSLRNEFLDGLRTVLIYSNSNCNNSTEIVNSETQAASLLNVADVAVTPEPPTVTLQRTRASASDSTDLDDLLSCTIIRKPGQDRSVETDEQTQPYLVSQEEKLIVDREATPLITNVCSLASDGAKTNNVIPNVDFTALIDGAVNNTDRSGTTPGELNAVPDAGNPQMVLDPKGGGNFEVQMGQSHFKVVGVWSVSDTDKEQRTSDNVSTVCNSTSALKSTNQNSTMLAHSIALNSLPPNPPVVTPPLAPLTPPTNTTMILRKIPTSFNQSEVDSPESSIKINFVKPTVLAPRPHNMTNLSMAHPRKPVYHTCPVRWVDPEKPAIPSTLFPNNFTTLEAYGANARGNTYNIIRLDSAKPLWTIAEEYLIVTEKFLPCTDPTYWTLEVRNRQLLMPTQNKPNTLEFVIDKTLREVKDSTEDVITPEIIIPETIVPDFVYKDTVESGNEDTTEETDTDNDVKVKIEDQASIVIENVCGNYVESEIKPNDVGNKDEKSSEVIDLDPEDVPKPKLKVKSFADYKKVEEKHRKSTNTDTKPEVLELYGRHFRKLTDNPLRYAVVFTVVSSTKELDQLFRERARLHLLPHLAGRLFPLAVSEVAIPGLSNACVNLPRPPDLTLMPNVTQPNMPRTPNLTQPNMPRPPNLTQPNMPRPPNLTQPNMPRPPNLTQPNMPRPPNSNIVPDLPQQPNLTELPNLTKAPQWTLVPPEIRTPVAAQNPVFNSIAQLPSDKKTGLLVRHHDTRLLQDLAFKLQDLNKSEIQPEENQIYVFAPFDNMLLTQLKLC